MFGRMRLALTAFALAGCDGADNTPASAADAKVTPAFVEGLPRNQWLTSELARPLGADGVVRDEKRRR